MKVKRVVCWILKHYNEIIIQHLTLMTHFFDKYFSLLNIFQGIIFQSYTFTKKLVQLHYHKRKFSNNTGSEYVCDVYVQHVVLLSTWQPFSLFIVCHNACVLPVDKGRDSRAKLFNMINILITRHSIFVPQVLFFMD